VCQYECGSTWSPRYKITQTLTCERVERAVMIAEIVRLRELHVAVEDLMQIVEGVRGERWSANGRRLVDTPEWCRLYVARCAINREPNKGAK
jgi:hypothetical protein